MSIVPSFLGNYEPLDVIGNGSFGIIRKVRRKQDGIILARKEIDFERMNERDRKQVVTEVNILKDLDHTHIVKYHDRYVDRDAGILHILMEYCGGGDLSSVIKQAQRHNRLIPEETVWHYFMQILLALHYCHHPNGNSRSGSSAGDTESKERRAPILHRDLKPDNVFLDENNSVKLGDFGLSKVLTQASLANTYVGTPYYMSPELMQEKAYDSKSDIWSLGCLIYELCAHKPPFHEAKTHSELSIAIRNGRIPPLPRGYSQALSSVIKAMLNLNPSMRPSAAQLLQHERLEFAYKVFETQKQLDSIKAHKTALIDRERELISRESAVAAHETTQNAAILQKDSEIAALRAQLAELVASTADQVQQAVTKREEELRSAVLEREKIVELGFQRREEEIMEAVRVREAELFEAWQRNEATLRATCRAELEAHWCTELEKLQRMKEELEEKARAIEEGQKKGKTPLEEVKNILAPLAQLTSDPQSTPRPGTTSPIRPTRRAFETPAGCLAPPPFSVVSAMKGVVLTETGESLATPMPLKLVDVLVDSPRGSQSLGFAKIFDFDKADEENNHQNAGVAMSTPTKSPSKKRPEAGAAQTKATAPAPTLTRANSVLRSPSKNKSVGTSTKARIQGPAALVASRTAPAPPPQRTSRLRRPSVSSRSQVKRVEVPATETAQPENPTTTTTSAESSSSSSPSSSSSSSSSSDSNQTDSSSGSIPPTQPPLPIYDLHDEENLPSPFLRRVDRERGAIGMEMEKMPRRGSGTIARAKRPSGANLLRAAAAANSAKAAGDPVGSKGMCVTGTVARSSSVVRKAGEEARKALLRM